MNTPETTESFEDGLPFVIEACGDDMWDEVLAQPAYNPALQKAQMAEKVPSANDLP